MTGGVRPDLDGSWEVTQQEWSPLFLLGPGDAEKMIVFERLVVKGNECTISLRKKKDDAVAKMDLTLKAKYLPS